MVMFNFLTIKDRQELSIEDFGDPDRRLFPVMTQEDVDKAPKRIKPLSNLETIKSRIMAIATKKGFTLPSEWETAAAHSEFAEGSAGSGIPDIAEFELDPSTVVDTEDGAYVLRTGKIFEAGQYPDKKFEITPEELCEAISDFKPVDVDLEHMPTILDGKLGKLEAVALGSDGWSLIGTVRLPKWLDSQLGSAERKVSATWDRVSKQLTKLALVRNPRVKDAALLSENAGIFAAFVMNEFGDTIKDTSKEELVETIKELMAKETDFANAQTWDGKALMQGIHDMSARSGAVCAETEKKFNELQEAGFVSASESKTIQQIHDTACRGGATCNFIKTGGGMDSVASYNDKEKKMNISDIKKLFSSLPDDLDVDTKEEKTELSDTKVAELAAREAAVAVAEKAVADREAALAAAAAAPDVAKDETTEEKTDEVANSDGPSARELELEAELKALRTKDIVREAEKFADAEIKAERAYPAERDGLIALFCQASADDEAATTKIKFKADDKEELTRVEALQALYAVRKPHNLTYEQIGDLGVGVLDTEFADSDNDGILGDPAAQAKAYAERQNKKLRK